MLYYFKSLRLNNLDMSRSLTSLLPSATYLSVFILVFGLFVTTSFGQKIRLRSQITPSCVSQSQPDRWKFADIYADGNIAVQGTYECRGAFIYDISNPDRPIVASWYNPGGNQQFLEAIVVGTRGYFGSGTGNGGVHIVDLTDPYNPVLLGTVDSTHGNGHNIIHEMVVLQQDGGTYLIENYNLLSSSRKIIKIINVSDPANPVFKWDLNPTDNVWVHAMHIRGNRMYLSGWGGKVEIYDISNLAVRAPVLIGAIAGSTNNHSTWTSEDGNYLYSCRELSDGDLRVYDVRNPAQPLLVRAIKAADLNLNAITPHNPVVAGNRLYVSWYQAGLQVFDISDPANPVRIGQYDSYSPTFAQSETEKVLLESAGPWDIACGNSNFRANLPTSYDGNWAVYPFLGQDKVLLGDLTNGLLVVDASKASAPQANKVSDFDGDGKTDLSVYTPASGLWALEQSSNGSGLSYQWGISDDLLVTGDYDGDGKSDIAVWRPSSCYWYILGSTNGVQLYQFGLAGDVPVPGDFDADGRTDLAVWRPSNGAWYIQQSTLGFKAIQWGANGDRPVVGDFEGDGKSDLAVWRPANGVWYVLQSSSTIPMYVAWGTNGDKPVSADFDGDGKTDFAVFRPSEGNWYELRSSNGSFVGFNFGLAEDVPIPADFDGDGKFDLSVFRPSTSAWYSVHSSDGSFSARVFGQTGDKPSPTSVQPQ
jgi:hypothetical protein